MADSKLLEDLMEEPSVGTEFLCAHCSDNNWELIIVNHPSNKTSLVIKCSNPDCCDKLKENLTDEDMILWEEFDITGQGYDNLEEGKNDPNDLLN